MLRAFVTRSLLCLSLLGGGSLAADNPLFEYAEKGALNPLSQLSGSLLQQSDHNGFTLVDYARSTHQTAVLKWANEIGLTSGVDKALVRRVQLWFYLLNVPVDNTLGIYNEPFRENILNFQRTRGLSENHYITPDWFEELEIEAIYTLQSRLIDLGYQIPLTGILDSATISLLQQLNDDPTAPLISASLIKNLRASDQAIDRPHLAYLISNRGELVEEEEQITQSQATEQEDLQQTSSPKVEEPSTTEGEQITLPFNLTRDEIDQILINARSGNVLTIQTWLKLMGFFPDELDGDMGPITRNAIKRYQRSINHEETGELHPSWEQVLEREVRKITQKALKELDLYHNEIDGIDGISTRGAIQSFERKQQIEETGSLSPHLLLVLFNQNEAHKRKLSHSYAEASEQELARDYIADADGEASLDQEASPQQQSDLTEAEAPTLPTIASYTPGGNENIALQQLLLAYLGYFKGEVDGISGSSTKEAIKAFQRAENLTADGVIGRATLQQLQRLVINKFQRYLQQSGYMEDNPTGTLGPKTRRAIIKLKEEAALTERRAELDLPLMLLLLDRQEASNYLAQYKEHLELLEREAAFITQMQKYLIGFGHLKGKADGIDGPSTQKALVEFRKAVNIPDDVANDRSLLPYFEKASIKQGQSYLKELGYKLSVDGIFGKNTRKEMNNFLAKHGHDQAENFNAEILMQLKIALDEQQSRLQRRAPSRATATTQPATPPKQNISMSQLSQKGQQIEGELAAAPSNRVSGRLELVRNNQGNVVGCRVNNISMGMRWCQGQKNGAQCSIFYKNGRVLSLRCN